MNWSFEKISKYVSISKETGCWEWEGCLLNSGYGQVRYMGERIMAHRLSYMIYIGEIPRGLFICHHCDNRRCVNPAHLFAGEQKDNMHDAIRKGRIQFYNSHIKQAELLKKPFYPKEIISRARANNL